MVQAGATEFMTTVGNVLPMTVVSRLIGFNDSDPQRLMRAAFDSTELLGSTLSLRRLTELIGVVGEIDTWIAGQLAAAANDPQPDILGSIATGVADGVMSIHEGTIILHTLLSAGGESTTSLTGNAVRVLAEDNALQQQLRADPSLIPAFVEEALRLHSPFRYLMRSVPQNTALGGVEIPQGATLLLFWGAANRDAAAYPKPDEIDLTRRLISRHLAFGRGIHHCVGAPLARLETKILLEVLLANTAGFTLDPDRPPRWVDSLLVRRHQSLPLKITRSK
jgi:cytochrome P450 family 144